MGLFSRGKSGGLMNIIRCDEPDYLVWKWRPEGESVNETTRENSIRYGSSLRVKDGEVAVFVYRRSDGSVQDFIYGPHDDTIKTANFPVLASIVGLGFGGSSPFQAEVYFINLSGVIKMPFGVPYFDVADPRFLDFIVPVAAGGSLTFKVTDPEHFIKKHRLIDFSIDRLKSQVKDAVVRRVKDVISNAPAQYGMPLVQIERKIGDINDLICPHVAADLSDFGVEMVRMDLSRIEPDKESEGWRQLRHVTQEQQTRTIDAQTDVNIKNLADTQRINVENMAETLRIQREEAQRAQRLQTETQFIGTHTLNRQADVMQTAAESLGSGATAMGGNGFNPGGVMTGMMMGGALGGQMAGMMNQMGNTIRDLNSQVQGGATPPPPPVPAAVKYYLCIANQTQGPFDSDFIISQLRIGAITPQTLVWCEGMTTWTPLSSVPGLAGAAHSTPPPPPPPGNV